jgi:hypothetical protein
MFTKIGFWARNCKEQAKMDQSNAIARNGFLKSSTINLPNVP